MTRFSRNLLAEWQKLELPLAKANVVVGVSGGADSTALLLALTELMKAEKISLNLLVAHLDHNLRGERSKDDAKWVSKLAARLNHRFVLKRENVALRAQNNNDNLEQSARRARYEFLAKVAHKEKAQIVLTGHTKDDQAETVLLNLLRGSGIDGLAGIEPVRLLNERPSTLLVRPLLRWARRAETQKYCADEGIVARQDEMNFDEAYSRVRVRRQLLPLMETFNGRVVEALARTAWLLRDDANSLTGDGIRLLRTASEKAAEVSGPAGVRTKAAKNKVPALCVEVLATATPALRRRALRNWLAQGRGDLRRLELVHLLAVDGLLAKGRGGRVVELPGGARVLRKGRLLQFLGQPAEGKAGRAGNDSDERSEK